MVIGLFDIHTIDFCDMDVMRLLIVLNSAAKVLPRFLRIAVIAPATAAAILGNLHGHIEVMRPGIFTLDKTEAVRKLDHSLGKIGRFRSCTPPFKNESPPQL